MSEREYFFDTETYWMPTRGKSTLNTVPRLVCVQWAYDDERPSVEGRADGCVSFLSALRDERVVLVGANTGFDLLVLARAVFEESEGETDILPEIFEAFEQGRVRDVLLRAKLNDIARGGCWPDNSLASVAKRAGVVEKVTGKKGVDVWRHRYAELDGVPVDEWPDRAYDYASHDIDLTRGAFRAYAPHNNEAFQCLADFWLKLATAHGLMLDETWAARVDEFYAGEEDKWRRVLEAEGLIVDGKLKRAAQTSLVEAAWSELGEAPWATDKGAITCDKKALGYLEEQGVKGPEVPVEHFPWVDPDVDLIDTDGRLYVFSALTLFNKASKFRTTYMEPILDAGPGTICAGYDCLKDSGRTSARTPNVQNFPSRTTLIEKARRKRDPKCVVGSDIRGCFVPRAGHVFVKADYSALEMAGLAQVLVNITGGPTNLAYSINEGDDLHLRVVASALSLDYEEACARHAAGDAVVKSWRDLAKVANYSFPTGASAATFITQARAQGVRVSITQAEHIRDAWFQAWPEMDLYRKYISRCETHSGRFYIEQHGPHGQMKGWRLRGTDRFTSAANTLFQGICADGAKWAGWLIARACYLDHQSPLFGSRTVLFIHDEFVCETPIAKAEDAANELSRLMVEGMRMFTPDIRIEAEPCILTDRWAK